MDDKTKTNANTVEAIAIVGMACRFPGANNIAQYWENIRTGKESISFFSDTELRAGGVPEHLLRHTDYVKAGAVLEDVDLFDAGFFGYSAREAEVMDPQHRLALECAWHAMEDAGHQLDLRSEKTGVFMGAGLSTYLIRNLLPNHDLVESVGGVQLLIHNDKDFLSTTVSYKLGLTGPSLGINTACSSSLVATHIAALHLLSYQCDVALAGGVSIHVPTKQGQLHQPGGIYSADGHCRTFDARAGGTVGGAGVGVVVLKRLADALADGDHIYATLLGSAVNNDGADKVGYTAPSIAGQAAVIREAHAIAGIDPVSIGYVEAHGTGTALGDPIEIAALTQAFGRAASARRSCAIGSVKANIGHTDAAAGVAGLIKVALILKHRVIPPSINFEQPNPQIDFEASPFYVNQELTPWRSGGTPRRAAVNSFGLGGTNAHVLLEEAPLRVPQHDESAMPWQLLPYSAKTTRALGVACGDFADFLLNNPEQRLADVAYTLSVGRNVMDYRLAIVCRNHDEAVKALRAAPVSTLSNFTRAKTDGRVSFMFPGQGSQYGQMGQALYRHLHDYREHVDDCLNYLPAELQQALRRVLGYAADDNCQDKFDTEVTEWSQLALFIVQYALARTLIGWGIKPDALIGHSLGEYTAACIAGVIKVGDALHLLVERSRLIRCAQPGAMLVVALSESDLLPLLTPRLSLAAVNAPERCTVSGPADAIEALVNTLHHLGGTSIRLPVDRAFHSHLLDPILDEYREIVGQVSLAPPVIPLLSNVTGTWLQATEATDPNYWVRHMRSTVRFNEDAATILSEGGTFVEVGPGRALIDLMRRQPSNTISSQFLPTLLPSSSDADSAELACFLTAVGQLWSAGQDVDFRALYENQHRQRVALPTYSFERVRYWIDPPTLLPNDKIRLDPGQAGLPDYLADIYDQAHRAEASMTVIQVQDQPELERLLNALCSTVMYDFIRSAGFSMHAGSHFSKAALKEALGIAGPYATFFNYMLSVLQEDSILHLDMDSISVLRELDASVSIETLHELLRNGYPQWRGLAEFLVHCARHFKDVLSGRRDGRSVLFPDGTDSLMRRCLVEESIDHSRKHIYTHLLGELLKTLSNRHGGYLRVLEFGAGSGLLTWELAQALPGKQFKFCVTDVSRLFVNELEKEAERRGYSHLEFGLFDIGKDPLTQGYTQGGFDLIVGLNVAHVAPDLRASLQNLQTLLSPTGVLALIETVRPDRWTQIISGMTPDWWAFEDDLRSLSPLLNLDTWERVLREQGFASVMSVPGEGKTRTTTDCGLLIAGGEVADSRKNAPLEALQSPQRTHLEDWFFVPSWKRSVSHGQISRTEIQAGGWLVFLDDEGIGTALVEGLRASGENVYCVSVGAEFHYHGDRRYAIRPQSDEDYQALVQVLWAENFLPQKIVHLWSLTKCAQSEESLESLQRALDFGLHSLTALAKALGGREDTRPCTILAVTNNAQAVLGDDLYHPGQAALLGMVKVAPLEYPFISCHCVDIDLRGSSIADVDWMAKTLLAEVSVNVRDPVVAYRGRYRWAQVYEPITYAESPRTPMCLRQRGVYLITGGLGATGLHIAEYLASSLQAKVALLSRSSLPSREHWDVWLSDHFDTDPTSKVIRRLQSMEMCGAEVMVLSADVSNAEQMVSAVQQVGDRFGTIHGVIHTAGIVDAAGVIHRRTRADTAAVLAPKVMGSAILERVLRAYSLDIFVIFSSLGSVLYKLKYGELGYVAASEFQNAFGHYLAQTRGVNAITIDWTDWQGTGMWARALERLEVQYSVSPSANTIAHALLPTISNISDSEWTYNVRLDSGQHWLLGEYKRGTTAYLPTVVFFDLIYKALAHQLGRCPMILKNVSLHSSLQVPDDSGCELQVAVSVVESGYVFKVMSRSSELGAAWFEHAVGEACPLNAAEPAALNIRIMRQSTNAIMPGDTPEQALPAKEKQRARWRLSEQIGTDAVLTHLELDAAYSNEVVQYPLHPALLDAALRSTNQHLFCNTASDYTLVSYQDVRIWRPLEPSGWAYAHKVVSEDDRVRLDIDILDEHGRSCLSITGCVCTRADATGKLDPASVALKEAATNTAPDARATFGNLPEGQQTGWAVFKSLVLGVSANEAIECFQRILHEGSPQVVVCTQDLTAMLDHQRQLTRHEHEAYVERTQKLRQMHQRPELSSVFQQPQTDIEQTLIEIWEDILGVSPIGVQDNFFELGGDSLIAIRLIARVRVALAVDLTIASLFEVPTVAQLAERIDTVIWTRDQSWDDATRDDDIDEITV